MSCRIGTPSSLCVRWNLFRASIAVRTLLESCDRNGTNSATGRLCRVMTKRSPASTRLSNCGRCVFASNAPILDTVFAPLKTYSHQIQSGLNYFTVSRELGWTMNSEQLQSQSGRRVRNRRCGWIANSEQLQFIPSQEPDCIRFFGRGTNDKTTVYHQNPAVTWHIGT